MNNPVAQDVSRETMERLTQYADLVARWTPKINLISKASLPDIWSRHMLDSVQIYPLATHGTLWVDIGSGAGFPGLVAAILAKEQDPDRRFLLVESDQRKSTFLRTVIRELDLNAKVKVARVEMLEPSAADILTARALADLTTLLGYAERHLKSDGTAIFPKGETWQKEVTEAQVSWQFDLESHRSKTDSAAEILVIRGIHRV